MLLVLGVLSIAALAAAWDHQEDTSLSEDLANSRLVRSPEAAAKRKRKNKPKRSGRKSKKVRKSKSGKKGGKSKIKSNFEKQKKRMEKQNGTGASKSSKKGAFAPIGLRLISVGGGNKSALSCGGKINNAGAKQLKNLTDILSACATNIHKMCGNFANPNMTKLSTCTTLAESFKKRAKKCLDM